MDVCMRVMRSIRFVCALIFFVCLMSPVIGQQPAAPDPQPGKLSGTVTDINDDIVPGAEVILQSSMTGERRSTISGDNGSFTFDNLKAGIPYQVRISSPGFVTWVSPTV